MHAPDSQPFLASVYRLIVCLARPSFCQCLVCLFACLLIWRDCCWFAYQLLLLLPFSPPSPFCRLSSSSASFIEYDKNSLPAPRARASKQPQWGISKGRHSLRHWLACGLGPLYCRFSTVPNLIVYFAAIDLLWHCGDWMPDITFRLSYLGIMIFWLGAK